MTLPVVQPSAVARAPGALDSPSNGPRSRSFQGGIQSVIAALVSRILGSGVRRTPREGAIGWPCHPAFTCVLLQRRPSPFCLGPPTARLSQGSAFYGGRA